MNSLKDKVKALESINHIFFFERLLYISSLTLALLLFFISAIYSLIESKFSSQTITVMFGSGSTFIFLTGQLIKFYQRAMNIVIGKSENTKDTGNE